MLFYDNSFSRHHEMLMGAVRLGRVFINCRPFELRTFSLDESKGVGYYLTDATLL